MKRLATTLFVIGAAALAGCGADYDGRYAGGTGFMLVAVMSLDGDMATVETVNTITKEVVVRRELEAEIRDGKLHLIRGDGASFVYGLGGDEVSLECLSDSCKGFGGLGSRGMPRVWNPVKG